ncbi:uncharacterized protein LOC131594168 [Vicia villosa]|uniref:uncharacterized protein LOC131594168 n=1 Tax=Vicia villosa TaxID=3911 RepID=UPI00273CB1CE|nr:uncharacterized protein LOC131594168 [Vicia villosa]
MEVMIHSSNMETFNFSNGTMSSPYLSPPSSPKRFGEFYLSAPSSPSRLSELYSQIDYLSIIDQTSSSTNKNNNNNVVVDDDVDDDHEGGGFAFFVNQDESKNSLMTRSAEELFHGGKIKPFEETKVAVEPRKQQNNVGVGFDDERRGRDRERTKGTDSSLNNNSGRRVTRSHSPYRKSNYALDLEEQNIQQKQQPRMTKEESKSSSSKGSRRWKLSDLLLFRSASEGRGSSKDPLKKHFVGYKKSNNSIEEVKGSSFRSSESFSRKKGQVSAHEMHYAMKKAESQDMKKRTFLPYRQGILGRLSGFGL